MKLRFPIGISTLLLAGPLVLFTGNASAAPSNVCKLIPAATAAKILGGTKATTQLMSKAGPDSAGMCNYSIDQGDNGFMLRVVYGAYTNVKQEVVSVKGNLSSHWTKATFKDVKGLGDAAILSTTPFTLNVFANGNYIMFNPDFPASPANTAKVEKLARVALAHLR